VAAIENHDRIAVAPQIGKSSRDRYDEYVRAGDREQVLDDREPVLHGSVLRKSDAATGKADFSPNETHSADKQQMIS
jgi:hypothetical protein